MIDGHTYWTSAAAPRTGTSGVQDMRVHPPIYDEYCRIPDRRSRTALPACRRYALISGQVAGTWKTIWKTSRNAAAVTVDVIPLRRLTRSERRALEETTTRYGDFLGAPVSLRIT